MLFATKKMMGRFYFIFLYLLHKIEPHYTSRLLSTACHVSNGARQRAVPAFNAYTLGLASYFFCCFFSYFLSFTQPPKTTYLPACLPPPRAPPTPVSPYYYTARIYKLTRQMKRPCVKQKKRGSCRCKGHYPTVDFYFSFLRQVH